MIRPVRVPGCMSRARLIHDERAAQIVEFAVALPLLVMFVVGIFDFSTAFTFKQRLTNMARDAAHVAAADPRNDVLVGTSFPISVADVAQIVGNYLRVNNLNDCGLSSQTTPANSGLTWTINANGNGCPPAGLTIVVNRGYYFPTTGSALPSATCQSQNPGSQVAIIGTCVSVRYPYPWKFGRVASLLGSRDTLPTQITAVGVSMNEN